MKDAIQALETDGMAQVRPLGGSMRGRIESGQLVTIKAVEPADVVVDDVVFVRWRGNYILHIVVAIDGDRLQIGNNLGKINGWADRADVLGRVVAVAD